MPTAQVIPLDNYRQLTPEQQFRAYNNRSRQVIRSMKVPHPDITGGPAIDKVREMSTLGALILHLDRETPSIHEERFCAQKAKIKKLLQSATPISTTPDTLEARLSTIEKQLATLENNNLSTGGML